MENANNKSTFYNRYSFMLRPDIFSEFKRLLALENISANKIMMQFMKNYVYFMDQSCLKKPYSKLPYGVPKIHTTVDIPKDVYTEFEKKLKKDNIPPSTIGPIFVEQYINYFSNLCPANEKE